MGGGSSKSIQKLANVADFKEHEEIGLPSSTGALPSPSPPKALIENTVEEPTNHHSFHEEPEASHSSLNTSMVMSIEEIYEAASQGLNYLREYLISGVDVNMQDSSVRLRAQYHLILLSNHTLCFKLHFMLTFLLMNMFIEWQHCTATGVRDW